MSEIIDERIVKLEFDNENFEKNIGDTIESLSKFEKVLLNLGSTVAGQGASSFFGNLGAALGNSAFYSSLNSISSGVDEVKVQFDALGIIGKRVLEDLTDAAISLAKNGISYLFNGIKNGGLSRALNIEDAKFRLKGLEIEWNKISDDINYGVQDTAYGLDQAAVAASMLAASGVKFGGSYKEGAEEVSEMGSTLRAISGVAAMTGQDFQHVGHIFTTVASNGKLMTRQIRQFAFSGMNVSSALVKYFNAVNKGEKEASEQTKTSIKEITGGLQITEEALNEMVTKGKIDFKVFAEAMDSTFGSHAKEANTTFKGAMANIRAAMSRIGATFFSPILEQNGALVKLLNIFRQKLDEIKATVVPFAEVITGRINNIIKLVSIFIEKLNFKKVLDVDVVKNIIDSVLIALINVFGQLYNVIVPISKAFKDVFPYDFIGLGKAIITMIIEMTTAFKMSENSIDNVYTISYAFFNLLKLGLKIIVKLGIALLPVVNYIGNLVRVLGNGIIFLAKWVSGLKLVEKTAESAAEPFFTFEKIIQILDNVRNAIAKFFGLTKKEVINEQSIEKPLTLLEIFKKRIELVTKAFERLKVTVKPVTDELSKVFNTDAGSALISSVGLILAVVSALNILKSTITKVEKKGLSGLLGDIFDISGITKITNGISMVLNSVSGSIDAFTKSIKLNNLKKIATSIAILTGSLLLLSLIPSNKIAGSLIMLGSSFLFLYLMFAGIDKIVTSAGKGDTIIRDAVPTLLAMSVTIATMAGALAILSGSLKLLSLADPKELIAPLIVTVLMLTSLWAAVATLTKLAFLNPNSEKTILSMSVLIGALGVVLASLSAITAAMSFIHWSKLLTGFGFMSLTMVAVVAAVDHLSKAKYSDPASILGTIGVLAAVTLSIIALGGTMALLSTIPWQSLGISLLAVASSLVGMGVVVSILSKIQNSGEAVQGALAIIEISASLAIFGAAIKLLETVNIEKAGAGLIAFAAVVAIFFAASQALGAAASAASEALAVIAIVGAILALYSGVFIGFAAGVDIFAIGAYKLLEAFKLLSTFSSNDIESMFNALMQFTGLFEILSLKMIESTAKVLNEARDLFTNIAITIVTIISQLSPLISHGVNIITTSIVGGILSAVPSITSSILVAYASVLNVLTNNMESIVQAAVALIIKFTETLQQYYPQLSAAVIQSTIMLLIAMKDAFLSYIPGIGNLILLGILNILNTITFKIIEIIIAAITKIIQVISNGISSFYSIMSSMWTSIFSLFEGISPKFAQFGINIMQGLINGLSKGAQSVLKFVANLANGILNTFRTILGIHSPSEVLHQFGIYLGEGLENGLDSMYANVFGSATRLGSGVKDGVEEGSSGINVFLDGLNSAFNGLFGGISNGAYNASMAVDMLFAKFQGYSYAVGTLTKLENKLKSKDPKAMYGGGYTAYTEMSKGIRKSYNSGNKPVNPLEDSFSSLKDIIDENTDSLGDFAGAAGGAGKGAKGAAKDVDSLTESFKSMEEMQSSLQDSISNSIDIFSEFSHESDLSADKLLSNMRSQVEGVKEWSKNLQTLAGRGIERGLLQKLTELGPSGWDKVQAFVQMTDEQLQEANGLYAESLMLPQSESEKITQSFAQAGMWATDGFVNGIYTNAGYQPGMLMGQSALNGLMTALDAHSPSEATKKIGGYATEGFEDGLEPGINKVYAIGINMGKMLVKGLNSALGKAMMTSIGRSVVISFANAFTKATVVTTSVKTFCDNIKLTMEKGLLDVGYIEMAHTMMTNIITGYQTGMTEFLAEIDLQNKAVSDKMLEAFTEIGDYAGEGLRLGIENKVQEVADETIKLCNKVVKAAKKTFDENSPSRVFEEIGIFLGTGLANGIKGSSSQAVGATTTMADATVNSFKSAISRVQDYIQNGMDDSLTITPVMDLSNIDAGLNKMSSLVGSRKFNLSGTLENASKVAAAFGGTGSGVNSTQGSVVNNTYTFNQTNTSPKALSNAEIYRQTNNLINRYRNDIGYA